MIKSITYSLREAGPDSGEWYVVLVARPGLTFSTAIPVAGVNMEWRDLLRAAKRQAARAIIRELYGEISDELAGIEQDALDVAADVYRCRDNARGIARRVGEMRRRLEALPMEVES